MKKPALKVLTASLLVTFLAFTGCARQGGQNPTPERQAAQTEQQGIKAPEQLRTLEADIEKIIKMLNGPAVEVKEEKPKGGMEEEKTPKESQKEKTPEGQGEQDKGNEKEGTPEQEGTQQKQGTKQAEGGQQKQEGQQAQAPPTDPFERITPVVNDLHYQWNSYMPLAVKMGANKGLMDNFSTALNSLTSTVISKNRTNTLMAASYLYAYVPDFYYLYKTQTSPEIKKIRHYTRNSMLNAMTGNWTQADTDLNNLKASWSISKNIIPKEQQESANKLDLSIYEFERVIKEKNQPLSDIKGRVTMANIQSLESAMEEGGGKGK